MQAKTFTRVTSWLGLSNAHTDLCKYGLLILVFIHWGACIWRMTPDLLTYKENWLNWDGASAINMIGEETIVSLYASCVEFSMMALVMGYGAIEPQNAGERWVPPSPPPLHCHLPLHLLLF